MQEEKTPAEDLETLIFVTRCFAGPQEDNRVIIKWCCYSLQRSTEVSHFNTSSNCSVRCVRYSRS